VALSLQRAFPEASDRIASNASRPLMSNAQRRRRQARSEVLYAMEADREHSPTPQPPVCALCHQAIQAEQDYVAVQKTRYHARCYERREARVTATRVGTTRRKIR
jgi:hypothetical protein